MKTTLLLLTYLCAFTLVYGATFGETNTFGNCESFENGIPPSWTVKGGDINTTNKRYKQGKQSLLWQWQSGSVITITDALLQNNSANTNAGIAFWFYNETASTDSLHIRFYDKSNRLQCAFYYKLNATGWRGSWVRFWQDMTGNNTPTELSYMEISAPTNTSSGRLFIDIVEFKKSINYTRTPSYQYAPSYPYDNNIDIKDDWESYLYEKKYPKAYLPLPTTLSDHDKEVFNTIANRYETWIFGSSTQTTLTNKRQAAMTKFISRGVSLAASFEIHTDSEGIMTGLPLFCNKTNHGPKFGRDIGEKLLMPLALDYRINGNESSKDKLLLLFDYMHDQGWAEGSSIESLDHQKLRMGAWVHAIYLMKDELAKTPWKDDQSKLDREMNTLRWLSAFHILFAPQDDMIAVNVDDFRSTTLFRLLYVLMMDNDNPQKVQYMNHYTQFLDRNLKTHEGWSDGIKPDGTGYHHRAPYMNAYSNNGVHVMTQILYFLRHTPYDVTPTAKQNLKDYLLNYRISNHHYDVPKAVSGRISGLEKTVTMMSPMIYLSHCFDETTPDIELTAAMKRLWVPEAEPVSDMINKYAMSIMLLHTMGEIELLEAAANSSIVAEDNPQGFWVKPYAAMAIFRGNNWSTTIKGTSAYVWDYETGSAENTYGRYDGYGQMEIANNTATYPSLVASGHDYFNGWNWSRIPGTTSVSRTLEQLVSDTDRTFSPNTFVGGVAHKASSGVWAMEFEDVHYNTGLEFKKSVFCFAPNMMVCLGSSIKVKNVFDAETTIFQNVISSSNTDIYVNETPITADNFTYTPLNQKATILDSNGKGIYLPNDTHLNINRQIQSSETMNEKASSGDVATAWFDHKAEDNYEYTILMNTNATKLKAFAQAPDYDVIQKDAKAHIVECTSSQQIAYAIFDATARFTTGLVRESSIPIMAMASGDDSEMILSICNPDFNRNKPKTNGNIKIQSDVYGPYQPVTFEVKLAGHWQLKDDNNKITLVSEASHNTTLIIESYDAANIEMTLTKDTTRLGNTPEDDIIIYPNPASTDVYFPLCEKAILYNSAGVALVKTPNTNTMNIAHLPNGYYILKLTFKEHSKITQLLKNR